MKKFRWVLTFSLILSMQSLTHADAATPKPGMPCLKSGHVVLSGNTSYTCLQLGKKLLWSRGVKHVKGEIKLPGSTPSSTLRPTVSSTSSESPAPSEIQTPSPSPSPSSSPVSLDPILVHLQDLIAAINLADGSNVPSVNGIVEDGPNGSWPSTALDAASYALKFYSAAGLVEKQSVVNVLLGRTQMWLQEESSRYAPNCVSATYVFTGNASLCSANWATVYSHLPDAITGDIRITDTSDLSLVTPRAESPYWPAMPHEIFHTYQQGQSSLLGLSSDSWPAWFREGSAQVMAYSAYQKYLGGNYLATLDISAQGGTGWGMSECTTGLPDLKPVCEYTEGFAASEFFVSRFGFRAYADIFSKPGPSDFPGRFLMATGESLDAFYVEVNQYLKSKGWASGQ